MVMSGGGMSFGTIDLDELATCMPEINNVYPPVPQMSLSDFTVPQQSIAGAFLSGLGTGLKANVNGLASAGASLVTMGMVDDVELWTVTDLDRAYGYDAARAISKFSGDVLGGVATGGLGCWSKGGSAMVRGVGYTAKMMDLGGNAVGAGKNAYDIFENGASVSNVVGLAGNTFGILGNATQACFTAGTQIVVGMDEKGDYVTKSIEDVREGNEVLAMNPDTGEARMCRVSQTYERHTDHLRYIKVCDKNSLEQTFETTDSHPFFVINNQDDDRIADKTAVEFDPVLGGNISFDHSQKAGKFELGMYISACDLLVGDELIGPNGEVAIVKDVVYKAFTSGIKVYNFKVEGEHNYFVIADADALENVRLPVLVHNAGYSSQTAEQLAQKLNTTRKNYERNIKPDILKQATQEVGKSTMNKVGRNPDIWINEDGIIGLKSTISGNTTLVPTTLKIEWFAVD